MSKSNKKKLIAEKLYKKYFKKLVNQVGNDITYDSELNSIGKKLFNNNFIGVFPSDKIPYLKPKQFIVSNLDTSNQPGSHWIGIVKDKKGLLIYDSFGRKSIKIIPSIYKKYKNIIDTEYDKEQKVEENNCGQRTLAFLLVYFNKGFDYAKYI